MANILLSTEEVATSDDVDRWVRELNEAGWKRKSGTIWSSPTGRLYLGPFQAWRYMKAQPTCTCGHSRDKHTLSRGRETFACIQTNCGCQSFFTVEPWGLQ